MKSATVETAPPPCCSKKKSETPAETVEALPVDDSSLLQSESFQKRYIREKNHLFEILLVIEGIRCAACVQLIESVLNKEAGVDSVMLNYFEVLSAGEWAADEPAFSAFGGGEGDPMALKHRLAFLIVDRLHGPEAAEAGAAHFRRVVQGKGVPEGIPERELTLEGEATMGLLDVLARLELVASRSEGRRLIQQGAVHLNGNRATDANQPLEQGNYLIRVGKRRYLNLKLANWP